MDNPPKEKKENEFKVPISKTITKIKEENSNRSSKLKITKKKKKKEIIKTKIDAEATEMLENEKQSLKLPANDNKKSKSEKYFSKYFHTIIKSKINRGFLNNKLSCFMNATLQCLLNCPEFFELLESLASFKTYPLKEDHPTCDALITLFEFFSKNLAKGNKFKAVDGESIFSDFYQKFNPNNEQQDAQEFLNYLLNQIDYEITLKDDKFNKNILMLARTISFHALTGKSPLSKHFAGFLQTTIKVKGNAIKESINDPEPFFILNLNPYNCNSFQEILAKYFSYEIING